MQLYLSKGRVWTGTQADAKEAQGGKNYQTIEVPDRKPNLIVWLNEQWASFMGDKPEPADTPAPIAVAEKPTKPAVLDADKLDRGDTMAALTEVIDKLGTFPLTVLREHIEARMTKLIKDGTPTDDLWGRQFALTYVADQCPSDALPLFTDAVAMRQADLGHAGAPDAPEAVPDAHGIEELVAEKEATAALAVTPPVRVRQRVRVQA